MLVFSHSCCHWLVGHSCSNRWGIIPVPTIFSLSLMSADSKLLVEIQCFIMKLSYYYYYYNSNVSHKKIFVWEIKNNFYLKAFFFSWEIVRYFFIFLSAQLPNCVNREMLDTAAAEFCMNHNTKVNRRRLVKALFTVHRTRTDLLPFYARLVATLFPCMPDVAAQLGALLKQDFRSLHYDIFLPTGTVPYRTFNEPFLHQSSDILLSSAFACLAQTWFR